MGQSVSCTNYCKLQRPRDQRACFCWQRREPRAFCKQTLAEWTQSVNFAYHCVPPSLPLPSRLHSKAQNASGKHLPTPTDTPALSQLLTVSFVLYQSDADDAWGVTTHTRHRHHKVASTYTHTHTKSPFLCVLCFSFTIITATARLDLFKRTPVYHTLQPRPHAAPRFRCQFWTSGKFTRNLLNLLLFCLLPRFRAAAICFFILKCFLPPPPKCGINIHREYEFIDAIKFSNLFLSFLDNF